MSNSIEMWAIRHNPSGKYLPMGPRQSGRGSTLREPEKATFDNLPRMFRDKLVAHRALRCWARGRYESTFDSEYGSTPTGEITPVATRKFEDMEIVPITLELP